MTSESQTPPRADSAQSRVRIEFRALEHLLRQGVPVPVLKIRFAATAPAGSTPAGS